MKTKFINTVLFTLFTLGGIYAQDVTTVKANNSDISDNLDLQAVASIFGESQDLEDFERRLNDPNTQISNLDLNGDGKVDYLRVIEVTENSTHVILLQAVLAADTFQDVASIEVERDRNNNVSVQVVGDTYIYGSNYIYEPVYVATPPIYNVFWVSTYRPYYSPWYYGYYPTYYNYWSPYPSYRYRRHVHVQINTRNSYNYVNNGRNTRAVALYNTRKSNDYERMHPNNSFSNRNANVTNRYQLDQNRGTLDTARASRNNNTRTTRSGSANTIKTSDSRSTGTRAVSTDSNNSFRNNNTTPAATSNRGTFSNSSSRNNAASQPATQPSRTYAPAATRNTNYTPANNSSAPVRSYTPASNPAPARAAAPAQSTRSFSQPAAQPVRSAPAVSAPARSATPATASPARQSNGGGRRN